MPYDVGSDKQAISQDPEAIQSKKVWSYHVFPTEAWAFEDPKNNANPKLTLLDPWDLEVEHNTFLGGLSPGKLAIGTGDWDYTASLSDPYVNYFGTTGNVDRVFQLPEAEGSGFLVGAWKVDDGTGDIDVTPDGTDEINGLNAIWKINGQHQFVILQDRAVGEWEVLDRLGTLLEFTSDAVVSAPNLGEGAWSNPAGHSLSMTPGTWRGGYKVNVRSNDTGTTNVGARVTLSTANNSETDSRWSAVGYSYDDHASTIMTLMNLFNHTDFLIIDTNTIYYLNLRGITGPDPLTILDVQGPYGKTIIQFRRIA